MLSNYILEKLYEKLGHKFEDINDVRDLHNQLMELDNQARANYLRNNPYASSVPINFHPYAITMTTLMRMVGRLVEKDKEGNIKEYKTRETNLDRIARYLGYGSYKALEGEGNAILRKAETYNGKSGFNYAETIYSMTLKKGCIVSFEYAPDRKISLRYMGNNKFHVIESINSRMQHNGYYEIQFFTPGQPLHARESSTGIPYQCGLDGGIFNLKCGDMRYPSDNDTI